VQDKPLATAKSVDSSTLAAQPVIAPALPGKISRTYVLATPKGMDLVFVDKTGKQADTIVVHIPENEVVAVPVKPNNSTPAAVLADRSGRHSFADRGVITAALIPSRWPDISLK
jgi:hypothetical protein